MIKVKKAEVTMKGSLVDLFGDLTIANHAFIKKLGTDIDTYFDEMKASVLKLEELRTPKFLDEK
jgi:hypothetical protein